MIGVGVGRAGSGEGGGGGRSAASAMRRVEGLAVCCWRGSKCCCWDRRWFVDTHLSVRGLMRRPEAGRPGGVAGIRPV